MGCEINEGNNTCTTSPHRKPKFVAFRFQYFEGRNHYYMQLPDKEEEEITFNDYFVAMKVNWQDKYETEYLFEHARFKITIEKYNEIYPNAKP